MRTRTEQLLTLGIRTDGILLPRKDLDLTRWATVACDQYTSEPEYWQQVEAAVGASPSTLRLIFPEVWLERETESEKSTRIARINETMRSYLSEELLVPVAGPVLTERTTRDGHKRIGLILSLDLECYDFSVGSQSLIRATEGTILDRLPPRIRIREHAELELPHIMILIDDPAGRVMEPLYAAAIQSETRSHPAPADSGLSGQCNGCQKLYDFPLMENSGHLRGWSVTDDELLDGLMEGLLHLANPETFRNRYGTDSGTGVLLYAVGDGNHSLATAKSCWEKRKATLSESERKNHPARFALIELVNVHDNGLLFEPIHRVLFGASRDRFVQDFQQWHTRQGIQTSILPSSSQAPYNSPAMQQCVLLGVGGEEIIYWENPCQQLAVGSLQLFLDSWLKQHPAIGIDYVHGGEVVRRHAMEKDTLGFLLPVMRKEELFPTVITDGALPRKTFSMGEAHEKRFYLECRKIR